MKLTKNQFFYAYPCKQINVSNINKHKDNFFTLDQRVNKRKRHITYCENQSLKTQDKSVIQLLTNRSRFEPIVGILTNLVTSRNTGN